MNIIRSLCSLFTQPSVSFIHLVWMKWKLNGYYSFTQYSSLSFTILNIVHLICIRSYSCSLIYNIAKFPNRIFYVKYPLKILPLYPNFQIDYFRIPQSKYSLFVHFIHSSIQFSLFVRCAHSFNVVHYIHYIEFRSTEWVTHYAHSSV